MWSQRGARGASTLRVATARPRRAFGDSQILDRSGTPVAVVFQPGGRLVAVWQRSARKLGFALARRGHGFGRTRDLASNGPTGGTLAIDPRDGTVVVAYGTPPTPTSNQQAAVRTLSPAATTFTGKIPIPSTGLRGPVHPAAAGGPGGAGVAFPRPGPVFESSIRVRRGADGSWAEPPISVGRFFNQEGVVAGELRAVLLTDGSVVALSSVFSVPADPLRPPFRTTTEVSTGRPPGVGVNGAGGISDQGRAVPLQAFTAIGDEAIVASALPGRPITYVSWKYEDPFYGYVGGRLAARGDGDVRLAGGGTTVVAVYQNRDRLQLKVLPTIVRPAPD